MSKSTSSKKAKATAKRPTSGKNRSTTKKRTRKATDSTKPPDRPSLAEWADRMLRQVYDELPAPPQEAPASCLGELRVVSFDVGQHQVRNGDLLLKRASADPSEEIIAEIGRSPYSHAAMAAWWNGVLMVLEMVQWRGGDSLPLFRAVDEAPGRWDVFEVNPDERWSFDRSTAVETMIRLTGTRYGWWNLAAAAVRRLPIVRLFARPLTDDKLNGSPPFCSQAVSRACRAGGVDPVPFLADTVTEPGDLAHSNFFRYRFTLVP